MTTRVALASAIAWGCAATAPGAPQLRGGISNASLSGASSTSTNLVQAGSAQGSVAPFSHMLWAPSVSYCLSADGNQIANGVSIQLWECDQTWRSAGQNMYFDVQGRLRMYSDPEYCVVVDGDARSNGARVQLWKCSDGNAKQPWSFQHSGQVRASGAATPMCLVIDGNRAFNGAKIQLWSCVDARADRNQNWVQLSRGGDGAGGAAYAVPGEDGACEWPFAPVDASEWACAAAAEALRPGQGCQWPGSPLKHWAEVVTRRDKPSWPRGCYFYGACQGGCSLDFNPEGAGASCPTQGQCMSIDVICQLRLP